MIIRQCWSVAVGAQAMTVSKLAAVISMLTSDLVRRVSTATR